MELSVANLCASYPGVAAVSHVDLEVEPGTVVAIVGPNGCGKSTLLRSIARLHRPDSGTVAVGGDEVWKLRPSAAARRMALLPQSPIAPEAITVSGLVAYGRHPHQGLFRQWSAADGEASDRALAATGVTELASRRLETLSGGQRQRCWLAMTLAQETPILLLDEPTSALDLGHAVETLEVIRRAAREGRSVIMVLHDLGAAARYADVLVAMKDGALIADGDPRTVVTSALVRDLYGIDADILAAPGDAAPVVVPRNGGEHAPGK
ncbi:MAG: ABC transporter ATP-binding protein [Stackebrandtia sp.]